MQQQQPRQAALADHPEAVAHAHRGCVKMPLDYQVNEGQRVVHAQEEQWTKNLPLLLQRRLQAFEFLPLPPPPPPGER